MRTRKLLLHKKEIAKISQAVDRQGMTMVPLRLYFNDRGLVKLQIAMAQGKKLHDKRDALKQADVKRDLQRAMRSRNR